MDLKLATAHIGRAPKVRGLKPPGCRYSHDLACQCWDERQIRHDDPARAEKIVRISRLPIFRLRFALCPKLLAFYERKLDLVYTH